MIYSKHKKSAECGSGGRGGRYGIVLAALAAAAACVATWLITAKSGEPATDEECAVARRARRSETVAPRAQVRQTVRTADTGTESEETAETARKDEPEWKPGSNIKPPNVPEGQAWVPGRPKVHDIEYVTANAGVKPVHRNAVEQNLINIFTCQLGDAPRPLGPMDFKDRETLTGILISPNPVTDKDAENVKVAKETLALAKKEMAKYMADGGNPEYFMQYYRNELLKAWKKRQDAQDMAMDMLDREGDPELAKAFVKRVNKELEAEGIKRIYLPAR